MGNSEAKIGNRAIKNRNSPSWVFPHVTSNVLQCQFELANPLATPFLHPGPSDTPGPQHWTWRHLPAPRQQTSSLKVTKIEAIHRAPGRRDILRCHMMSCSHMSDVGKGFNIRNKTHMYVYIHIHMFSLSLPYFEHDGTTSACKSTGRVLFTAFGSQIPKCLWSTRLNGWFLLMKHWRQWQL